MEDPIDKIAEYADLDTMKNTRDLLLGKTIFEKPKGKKRLLQNRSEKWDKTEKLWTEYSKLTKRWNKASMTQQKKIDKKILGCLTSILAINPKDWKALNRKGVACFYLDKEDDALKCFEQVLQNKPNDIDSLGWKGKILFQQLQDKEALECYKKIHRIDPKNVEMLRSLGVIYRSMHKYEKALESYEKIIKIDNNIWQARNEKGIILRLQHKYEEALKCFDKIIEMDIQTTCPDCGNKHGSGKLYGINSKGVTFGILGDNRKALEYFEQALKISPNNRKALQNKASALDKLKMNDKALECYQKLIKRNPRNPYYWTRKGNRLLFLGKRRKALVCYAKAIKLAPNDSPPVLSKGITYEELCENQKALECYEKANNLEPKHGSLIKFRALNSKARILGKLGRYQEQLDCYEIMLKNKATALSNKPYSVKSQSKRYIVVEASIREIKAKLRSEENLR